MLKRCPGGEMIDKSHSTSQWETSSTPTQYSYKRSRLGLTTKQLALLVKWQSIIRQHMFVSTLLYLLLFNLQVSIYSSHDCCLWNVTATCKYLSTVQVQVVSCCASVTLSFNAMVHKLIMVLTVCQTAALPVMGIGTFWMPMHLLTVWHA